VVPYDHVVDRLDAREDLSTIDREVSCPLAMRFCKSATVASSRLNLGAAAAAGGGLEGVGVEQPMTAARTTGRTVRRFIVV